MTVETRIRIKDIYGKMDDPKAGDGERPDFTQGSLFTTKDNADLQRLLEIGDEIFSRDRITKAPIPIVKSFSGVSLPLFPTTERPTELGSKQDDELEVWAFSRVWPFEKAIHQLAILLLHLQ